MHKRFFTLILSLLLFAPVIVFADEPIISSFSASPSYISYGYSTLLSWSISGVSYGQDLYLTCPPGVSVKNSDGTALTCNSYQSVGTNTASGSAGLFIANVSGGTVPIRARLVPRNASGVRNEDGALETLISVGTSPQPLLDFKLSTTTALVGEAVVLSWVGNDLSGVNIQFECVNGITFTSTNPSQNTALPCGTLAYTTDLPNTGSITVAALNDSLSKASVVVRVFPALGSGLYDGTHSMSLSFTVLGKTIPLTSAITSFGASPIQVVSGNSISFSWSATNASGVNLQFQCDSEVSVFGVDPSSTTSAKLLCNVPAFTTAFPTTASTSVTFLNRDTVSHTLLAVALPKNSDGTYNGVGAKSMFITVARSSGTQSIPAATTALTQPQTSVPQTGAVGAKKIVRDTAFSAPLYKGSRGAQVTALQKLLAQDVSLYPEQVVSGYFGALTELALKRFQERYSIAKKGDSGYGFVGPKTLRC
jgi:hypothetical protein